MKKQITSVCTWGKRGAKPTPQGKTPGRFRAWKTLTARGLASLSNMKTGKPKRCESCRRPWENRESRGGEKRRRGPEPSGGASEKST